MVIRIASAIGLAPSRADEYLAWHSAVWPAVLERLSASNIRNYSIYRFGDVLFSYLEYVGDDFETDMQALRDDPATRRWTIIQASLQRPLDGGSTPRWIELPELFHLP